MEFSKAIRAASTKIELCRFASAYVVDHRNLRDDEIVPALEKTAPQYFFPDNIWKALTECVLHADRDSRLLSELILREVLLNRDGFISSKAETEDDVAKWEQRVVDESNEAEERMKGVRATHHDFFRFVVQTAWDMNNQISADEKNLVEKIRERLNINEREHRVIEARLGKFPTEGNRIHGRGDIDSTRKLLQSKGLLLSIRDADGTDYDVIPKEIAAGIRRFWAVEMRRHGFLAMLESKFLRSKDYLVGVLNKTGHQADRSQNLDELRGEIIARVQPTVVLGGHSPKDGLATDDLRKWCGELGLMVSGAKAELISRIIGFYDNLREREGDTEDERKLWYGEYERLACRDLPFFRGQQLIQKDIEIERRFEEATNYLFEVMLGHTPLKQVGSNHADGVLSFGDGVLLWDNKSSETPVHLKSFLKQFDGYVKSSDKRVLGFLVIGPSFTEDSGPLAMDYFVNNGVIISLIEASALRALAEEWNKVASGKQEATFPLRYLIQQGLFSPALVRL